MTERYIPNLEFNHENSITIDSLIIDNTSEEANRRRDEWDLNRENKQIVGVEMCGDARVITPNPTTTADTRSIAAAGDKNFYLKFIYDPRTSSFMILVHFDGDTAIPKEIPTGCGGLGVMQAQIELPQETYDGVHKYINKQVRHPDSMLQACMEAQEISRLAGEKSVLAALQDHLTGNIIPIAEFQNGHTRIITPEVSEALEGKYDPKRLYENGIPRLDLNLLTDDWQKYFKKYQLQLQLLHANNPNLREKNKVQDPRLLSISTGLRPFETKFPKLGDSPNTIFKLKMPRMRDSDGKEWINPQTEEEVIRQQSQYPLEHFLKMKRTVIDSASMDTSRFIANSLREQQWTQEWESKGGKLIFAQTKDGVITDIDEFR